MMADEWLNDICTLDKNGNLKLVPSKTASWLMEQNNFVTIEGTNTIMIYDPDSGAWKNNGEQRIKNILQTQLGELLSRNTVSEITEHIRRTEYISPSIINSKDGLINLKNGVFDALKGELVPHAKDYYFTYTLPFPYDKNAECKKFMGFLADITDGDAKIGLTILEGFAYTFIPSYPIQRAVMLVGGGANGKGTLLNVLRQFVGPDNCSHLTLQVVAQQTGFALARLQGKLLNIGPDLPAEMIEDAGNFKAVTGGDTLDANIKYQQDAVKLRNSAKLWYSANQIPVSEEDTAAYYRRWVILKFKKQYGEGRDILPELTTERELQGIFNLVMEFYPIVKQNLKYTFSKNMEETRRDYLKSSDSAQVFVEACLQLDNDADVPKSEIFVSYGEFCKKHGLVALGSEDAFWRKLRKKITYIEHTPQRGGPRYIKGQRLVEPEPETVEETQDSKKVLENYQELHHLQHLQHHFSLLLLIYIDSSFYTTIRVKGADGDDGVANATPIDLEGNSGTCSVCGTSTNKLWDVAGVWRCAGCLPRVGVSP